MEHAIQVTHNLPMSISGGRRKTVYANHHTDRALADEMIRGLVVLLKNKSVQLHFVHSLHSHGSEHLPSLIYILLE